VVQPPLLAPAIGERLREQLAGRVRAEPVLLVGSPFVGVRRRDLHVVDVQLVVEVVQYVDDVLRAVGVEERGVRHHPEPGVLRHLDRRDRLVEHALLAHRRVVPLA
jgi:hypothetical protein